MDITPAYNNPNLKKLLRTMTYSREASGSVELADQFDLASPSDIVESFPTHGTVKQIDATIHLAYSCKVVMHFHPVPAN